MAVEIVMPRLSDSMEEGTIARWLVEEGAEIARGQPLVEIDTDKATMEYESQSDGTVLKILLAEGETAAIGTPIARIGAPGEAVQERGEPGRVNASPIAKRIAQELRVDLSLLQGAGTNGMITKEDVERAAEEAAPMAPSPRTGRSRFHACSGRSPGTCSRQPPCPRSPPRSRST